jgi:hypothetical protein
MVVVYGLHVGFQNAFGCNNLHTYLIVYQYLGLQEKLQKFAKMKFKNQLNMIN